MRLGPKIPLDPKNPDHFNSKKYKLNKGDVYIHTIRALEYLKNEKPILQLAGLLHDIGKPATKKVLNGKISNKGHDKIGAEMADLIMLRLKFSNDEIDFVKSLVENHMKQHIVKEFRKSTLKRYLASPYFDDLLKLNTADVLSSYGDLSNIDFINEKLSEWEPEEIKPSKKKLVNGHDLIKLGFKPGPIFSTILNKLEDLYLEDKIKNKKDGISYVKENYI